MPAKNPRINVVLEKPLYSTLHQLAQDQGISLSMLMRDLVREALELREDQALADFAAERATGNLESAIIASYSRSRMMKFSSSASAIARKSIR